MSDDARADEADAEVNGGTEASHPDADDDESGEIRAALAEIRRECLKAAFVYASLDAVCVVLAVDLATTAVGLPALDVEVAASSFDALGLPSPDLGTLAGALAGLLAFVAEFVVRARRPAVERFETANPEVREALRTARDAADADRSNAMTRALYADVLDRLRGTSSVGLLDATRLAVTVVIAVGLSLATVQTAVVGIDLGAGVPGSGPGAGASGDSGDRAVIPNRTADLRNGDEVLGEPTDVSAGSENLSAAVSASPGGEGQREWDYDAGGSDGEGGGVDAQRAAFASPDRVEDAALVQRYANQLQANSTDD